MIVIEIYSVAFKLTGLATKKIKFQVASLFTSAGYTTAESELITNHDGRRKIAVACMYTGHIFSVLIMGLIINVFVSIGVTLTGAREKTNFTDWYFIAFYISVGLFLLVLILKIPPINRKFLNLLERIAVSASKKRRNTNIITVLDFYGKSAIVEVILNKMPPAFDELPLFKMNLTKKYVINVLSIRRGARTVEVTKDTMFRKGDVLVIYGLINDIQEAFLNSIDNNNKTIVINKTNELSVLNNYGANTLMEVDVVEVPKELEGIKMKDSHLSDRYSINIVVIKRNEEHIFADKDTIIQNGDKITLFGPYNNIKHLFKNDDNKKGL